MDKAEAIIKIQQYRFLLKEYLDVDKVYLFGSYAKETNIKDSDIDVAIVVNSIKGDYFTVIWLIAGFIFMLVFKNSVEKLDSFKLNYKTALLSGISFVTTQLAPIATLSPIFTAPIILAPGPI